MMALALALNAPRSGEQPPTCFYAEVVYEAPSAGLGARAAYAFAEAYADIRCGPAGKQEAEADALRLVREGGCFRSVHDLDGGAVYLDPPICVPSARIVQSKPVPYREPGQ